MNTSLPEPKLVIFDCDGTLVDTEVMHLEDMIYILREYGTPPTMDELYVMCAGQTTYNSFKMFKEQYGWDLPDDIDMIYRNYFLETLIAAGDKIAVSGALKTVQDVAHRYPVAVATNGEVNFTNIKLNSCGFLAALPDLKIYTKDLVARPKPAPDLFLHVAAEFGIAPKDCWVIEDSVTGVTAAVAAGMHTIGFTACTHDKAEAARVLKNAGAALIIEDYADFPLESEKRLIA